MIISKVAFKEGRKAYNDGKAKSDNPYPKFDKNQLKIPNREYISWNQGYDYIKKGNIEESKMSNIQKVLEQLLEERDNDFWEKGKCPKYVDYQDKNLI